MKNAYWDCVIYNKFLKLSEESSYCFASLANPDARIGEYDQTAQADSNLRWAHMSKSTFSHVAAYNYVKYSRTSIALIPMARLPWLIRTRFWVPTKFFRQLKKKIFYGNFLISNSLPYLNCLSCSFTPVYTVNRDQPCQVATLKKFQGRLPDLVNPYNVEVSRVFAKDEP